MWDVWAGMGPPPLLELVMSLGAEVAALLVWLLGGFNPELLSGLAQFSRLGKTFELSKTSFNILKLHFGILK